jgi:hypothetical protein
MLIVTPNPHKPNNGPKSIAPLSDGGVGKVNILKPISDMDITIPVRENIFPNLG